MREYLLLLCFAVSAVFLLGTSNANTTLAATGPGPPFVTTQAVQISIVMVPDVKDTMVGACIGNGATMTTFRSDNNLIIIVSAALGQRRLDSLFRPRIVPTADADRMRVRMPDISRQPRPWLRV